MSNTTVDKKERLWLRIAEAARRLDVHPQTAHRWAREGRLPVVQLGGPGAPLRVDAQALDEWVDAHARGPEDA